MNLYYMLQRRDKNLLVAGEVREGHRTIWGELWRGATLGNGASLTLPDATRFFPLRARPDMCSWYAELPAGAPDLVVRFVDRAGGATVGEARIPAGCSGAVPIRLPWPRGAATSLDLVLAAEASDEACRAPVFVASHRALSRQWLYDEAVGTGIEIGPGPQPQILPRDGVAVSYLEQMPPDEWNRLYNQGGKYPTRPELWENYVVGDAHDLPCADGSLDFVFGSHVFEHLANPIGHLERWHAKLRSGGRILCVVPDLTGAKDYFQVPSRLAELVDEHRRGQWEPDADQYARFMARPGDDKRVQKAIAERSSIHAHFYTNTNIVELLDHACQVLGYAGYSLNWSPNHKDFHFMLKKA